MNHETTREQAKQIVRDYVDAVNGWDFPRVERLLDEHAVLHLPYVPPGIQSRYEGRDTIVAFMRAVSQSIPAENLHDLVLYTLHEAPEDVICTYKSDMRVNGRPYRNEYIALLKIRNGRVTYFGEYFDPIRLLLAMGGKVEGGSFGS